MTTSGDGSTWLRALHLASPALPVGGFSYSQGLESAFACGLIPDASAVSDWIAAALDANLERFEACAWVLHHRAWSDGDWEQARLWNSWFLSARESAELRQETEQMGWSMVRLIDELGFGSPPGRAALFEMAPVTYPAASAFAYAARGITEDIGCAAFCFAWLESQVAAAIKIVPLGQAAGQRILVELGETLTGLVARARDRANDAPERIETFAPQLAILSARHETQYSRLFRS